MRTRDSERVASRYLIQDKIAEQGGVEIYDALDERLSRSVTLQLLTPDSAANPDISRGFLRHQQIASAIHNCRLFAVYDAGTWQGRPFSVMERLKGSRATTPGAATAYDPARRVTLARQAAESLACLREAGLSDWTFSPEAVWVDTEGNACIAVLEGLDGSDSSARAATDGRALTALLSLMVAGYARPEQSATEGAGVPPWLMALLSRVDTGNPKAPRTAAEFAGVLAGVEAAAAQRTEAYATTEGASAPGLSLPGGATLPLGTSPDAPTVAALVVPTSFAEDTALAPVEPPKDGPYTPSEGASAAETPHSTRRAPIVLLVLAGLIVLALGVFVLVPRFREAGAGAALARSDASTVAVPDLKGMTLDRARSALQQTGLNMTAGAGVFDPAVPRDQVVGQDPPPGSLLEAGHYVTVQPSLGAQPPPTASATALPASTPPPAVQDTSPAPNQQPAKGNKGGEKRGKGHK